jgi:hypothetical protein
MQPLEAAILRTVAYSDLFDYPLTAREIHRFLAGVQASLEAVEETLENALLLGRQLETDGAYVTLPGRRAIVETRLRREKVSARLWRKGTRYGEAIASLPFVRMVAVTGTLAVNNAETGEDIDYLIVTVPGRVWLARLLVLVLVHLGRLDGLILCPNYVFGSDALAQFQPSFFAAHELAQMVPLYGLDVYQELLRANAWARSYLPNAFVPVQDLFSRRGAPFMRLLWPLKRGIERLLQGRLGDALEERESRIKIAQLREEAARCGASSAAFTPNCCKGHMEDHGRYIAVEYAERLRQLGLDARHVVRSPAASK